MGSSQVRPQPGAKASELVDIIPNWTPINDATIVDPTIRRARCRAGDPVPYHDRGRLFASTGQAHYGAITEMRHGFQAFVETWSPFHRVANRMWWADDPDLTSSGKLLVFSFAFTTEVIHVSFEPQSFEARSERHAAGLSLSTNTLAVGRIGSATIQITPGFVAIISMPQSGNSDLQKSLQRCGSGESIAEAALHPYLPYALTAVRKDDEVELRLSILPEDKEWVAIYQLLGEQVNHIALLYSRRNPRHFTQVCSPIILDSVPSHLSFIDL